MFVLSPLFYFLSSGPMVWLTWHSQMMYEPVGPGGGPMMATREIETPGWWSTVYGPLEWVSQQPWGEWMWQYWSAWIPEPAPPSEP